jgi:hypothetical protein
MALAPETEQKIRDLGQALKLQLDFAASADWGKQDDQLRLAENNMTAGKLMIGLMRELKVGGTNNDADVLDAIVSAAEKEGSTAGDVLKQQVPKVRAINADMQALVQQRFAAHQMVSPEDINGVFRKHLKP